jgi:hypothetical protein
MNKLVDTEAGEEREEERVKEGADGGPASSKEAGSSEDDVRVMGILGVGAAARRHPCRACIVWIARIEM